MTSNLPPRRWKARGGKTAVEIEKMATERAKAGFACVRCGREDSMYHHGAPLSGLCRSCSHIGQASQKADYTGQEFNGHTVLSLAREKRKNAGLERFWNVRCLKCGLESVRAQWLLRKKVCHVCLIEAKREARRNSPRLHAAHDALVKLRHTAYARGRSCRLTEPEVENLIFLPCSYCGVAPSEKGHGVDRIDSSKDYEPGNVAACCWDCNRAKGTLTLREFGEWLDRITAHRDRANVGKSAIRAARQAAASALEDEAYLRVPRPDYQRELRRKRRELGIPEPPDCNATAEDAEKGLDEHTEGT